MRNVFPEHALRAARDRSYAPRRCYLYVRVCFCFHATSSCPISITRGERHPAGGKRKPNNRTAGSSRTTSNARWLPFTRPKTRSVPCSTAVDIFYRARSSSALKPFFLSSLPSTLIFAVHENGVFFFFFFLIARRVQIKGLARSHPMLSTISRLTIAAGRCNSVRRGAWNRKTGGDHKSPRTHRQNTILSSNRGAVTCVSLTPEPRYSEERKLMYAHDAYLIFFFLIFTRANNDIVKRVRRVCAQVVTCENASVLPAS
jgi:hypothetical protein